MALDRKKKQHHEEHMDETWLIPYADLLTLLLALFIILFAASQIDSEKYQRIMHSFNDAFTGSISFFNEPAVIPNPNLPADKLNPYAAKNAKQLEREKETTELMELKDELDQYAEENGFMGKIETILNDDQLMIMIRDHALFDSGSAEVKQESRPLAFTIGEMLAEHKDFRIEVSGHTDNVPIHSAKFDSNWDLSTARALSFMKILLKNKSIDESRFKAIGYGEFKPIESNDTAEGRAKNRRVEISIKRNSTADDSES